MKKPPPVFSYTWFRDDSSPEEGAVLATDVVAVQPSSGTGECLIHLRGGSVLSCEEPAPEIIRRWVEMLMMHSETPHVDPHTEAEG